jgi:hypothetical protein
MADRPRRAALVCAVAATGVALAWQALTVRANFAGDWSAFYYTGAFSRVPSPLAAERLYTIPGSAGYDGQYYHFIAHDPWLRRGFAAYVDNPGMRWRRILVPGLAALLSGFDDDYTDSLYAVVLLASVFLGAYWLSRWCAEHGYSPWLGMGFLLAPATPISLDRATVDVALAALTVGFALHPGPALYGILAAAPLARETGLLLIAAQAACAAGRRRWREVAWSVLAALPFFAWAWYVGARTAPDLTSHTAPVPFGGIVGRALRYAPYALDTAWLRRAAALDYLAFLGLCAGLVLACVPALRRRTGRVELAALAFSAALVFVSQPQVWAEAYAFGRIASPLLILLALEALRDRWWWGMAPLACVLPRVLWQLGPQFWGVLRGA